MSEFSNILDPEDINHILQSSSLWSHSLQEELLNENFVDEDTMVQADQHEQPSVKLEVPALPGQPYVISNEDYSGPHCFDVFINPHHGNKSPWTYSSSLNKMFILMNENFPVDFKWSGNPSSALFVRATPLYPNQYQHEMVVRCIAHAQKNDKSNNDIEPHVVDHVIRCHNPQAVYEGARDTNHHLSVVTPLGLPQTGSDTVRQVYEFVCKNSCPTGMNRRQLEVVFTLEDYRCNVLGRKTLNVRVCSCPKRDKEKEEKDFYKSKSTTASQGKKRKLVKKPSSFTETNADTKEYEVNIKVIGKKNRDIVMKFAHDLMAGEIMRHNQEQPYIKCLQDIAQAMHNSSE